MGSLAIDQTLALAMARHGRLGASSSAASLEADTIEHILAFVREAHKDLLATRRIVSICVKVSRTVGINRIEISYSDGTHTAHGGHSGEWQRPLRLQPGEYITSVSGHRQRLLLAHPSTCFAPSPNAPLLHRIGALVQGHDIEIRQCTLEQAKALVLELPNCAGFTFHSAAPQFDGVQTVHFKDRRDGNTDWRWQSYLRADWAGADPAPLPYHGTPS